MPVTTTCRIVDPLTGTQLLYLDGWSAAGRLKSLDFGAATVRETKTARSGAHGMNDQTRWFGDRTVTAVVNMPEQPYTDSAVDALQATTNPALRLWLYVQRPSWPSERRILVRGAGFTCPPGIMRDAQVQWVAPAGLLQDSVTRTVTLNPTSSAGGGIPIPLHAPIAFVGGFVAGATQVAVGGTISAPVVIDIYGPCTDPLVRCVDTGEQVSFPGLSIAAGDYLHVDTAARTAQLNSDPAQSRYNLFDFTSSSWWQLPPGRNVQVLFSANAPSGSCEAVLSWAPTYL